MVPRKNFLENNFTNVEELHQHKILCFTSRYFLTYLSNDLTRQRSESQGQVKINTSINSIYSNKKGRLQEKSKAKR